MNLDGFYNKKVLVTGHTGFKGSWLSTWLSILGAKVYGFSDKVPTQPAHYNYVKSALFEDIRGDIRSSDEVSNAIYKIQPK